MQNADDAAAKSVEIHFNTRSYIDRNKIETASQPTSSQMVSTTLPDLKKEPLSQWEFKNDGTPFREDDWNRLKKIAEGNPVGSDLRKDGAAAKLTR